MVSLLSMSGGMIGGTGGAFIYMPTDGQWRPMGLGVTVTLIIMFFIVNAGVAVLQTLGQLAGSHAWPALTTACWRLPPP